MKPLFNIFYNFNFIKLFSNYKAIKYYYDYFFKKKKNKINKHINK